MPAPAPSKPDDRPLTVSDRGRVRAVLLSLEDRWDGLTLSQRARALELLAELSAAVRTREVREILAAEVRVHAG